jgi:hypothetical protein
MTKFSHRKALVALSFPSVTWSLVTIFSDSTPSGHTGSNDTSSMCVLCSGAESIKGQTHRIRIL